MNQLHYDLQMKTNC